MRLTAAVTPTRDPRKLRKQTLMTNPMTSWSARRVSVRNWQGKIWIDIREFFVKDGKQFPGKKGISLSVDQWNILRDHVEAIDRALGES
ncbi:RNA polymerase II transcriptional coactivator KIWI-like isoform X3 [Pistacia vera]|uniref:RNA polymerase II transcriptional coactivator KIWI-like isoform X3 n=1 Tax=Pistacia vera TaxID=55513 RepID=UPI00126347CD|nr:RNA polymerase II transcriptional coactivator KIWI-like isoform X3 [Pistacia vera]